jgi:hypothetical protein
LLPVSGLEFAHVNGNIDGNLLVGITRDMNLGVDEWTGFSKELMEILDTHRVVFFI